MDEEKIDGPPLREAIRQFKNVEKVKEREVLARRDELVHKEVEEDNTAQQSEPQRAPTPPILVGGKDPKPALFKGPNPQRAEQQTNKTSPRKGQKRKATKEPSTAASKRRKTAPRGAKEG